MRYAVFLDASPEGIPFACPSCRTLRGHSSPSAVGDGWGHRLKGPPCVRVKESEIDGVPCYGLRAGATRRRPAVRGDVAHVRARTIAYARDGAPDYWNGYSGLFDTWCLNCKARIRVDPAQIRR